MVLAEREFEGTRGEHLKWQNLLLVWARHVAGEWEWILRGWQEYLVAEA